VYLPTGREIDAHKGTVKREVQTRNVYLREIHVDDMHPTNSRNGPSIDDRKIKPCSEEIVDAGLGRAPVSTSALIPISPGLGGAVSGPGWTQSWRWNAALGCR